MSLDQIRSALFSAVESAKVGFNGGYTLLIEYDNRIVVDTTKQTDPFLTVELDFSDSEQADLSNNPVQRYSGMLTLNAAVPLGSGRAQALKLLDWFYPQLQRKAFGVVRTEMARVRVERRHNNWVYYPVYVPFRSDQLS